MTDFLIWALVLISLMLILYSVCILIAGGNRKKKVVSEITDLQAKIADLEFEQKLLSEQDDVSLVVIGQDSNVLIANQAARSFFLCEKPIGVSCREFIQVPEIISFVEESIGSRKPAKARVHLRPKGDQREQFIAAEVKFLSDPRYGECTRISVQDVTEHELNEMIRKDFVANASHELRTPLAIINGYVETMMDEDVLSDKETSQYFLKIMQRHGKRLARIIEEMLMITKLEARDHNPLKLESFPVRECIDDSLSHLDQLITESKAQIHIEISDSNLMIEADRFYLSQVLFNLVENAIKQNPQMVISIKIGARESAEDNTIIIWVSDNGKGIPAADIPFIFRRFYRVAKDHSQQEIKGTGLGLSIVIRAVEAHKGTIECQSKQGEETTFTLTMPRERKD